MRTGIGIALNLMRAGGVACWIALACAQAVAADTSTRSRDNFTPTDSEQLLSTATLALENRDYKAAERAVSAALQIIKANHGLLTDAQFPALQMLAEALQAQNNWSALDRQFAYFEWLLGKLATADIESYLSGTEILNSLYLAAAADDDCPQNAYYLVAAKHANWRAVTAIEQRFGVESLRLAPWLYKIVLNHYYQSALIRRRGMTSFDYKSDAAQIVNGWSLSKNESVAQSYNIGLELLHRIRHLYADPAVASPAIDAQMLISIADWELLFERGDIALDYYRLAYARLQTAGLSAADRNDWFAAPVIIPRPEFLEDPGQRPRNSPDFRAWSPVFPGVQLPPALARAELSARSDYAASVWLTLSAEPVGAGDGHPGDFIVTMADLRIESAEPDNPLIANQARRQIAALQFRPALLGGLVVPETEVRLTYFFNAGAALTLPVSAR